MEKRKYKKAPLTSNKKKLTEQQVDLPYPKKIADFSSKPYKPVSLDQIVDRYFIRYEKESIPTAEDEDMKTTMMNEFVVSSNVKKLTNFLFEQDAPPPAGLPPVDGGGGGPPKPAPVLATPTINLNDFARSVARLVNNFEALLDPKTVLLNRAEAYIASNYDEKTARFFKEIMENNYGLKPQTTEYPETHSIPPIYGTSGPNSAATGGGG